MTKHHGHCVPTLGGWACAIYCPVTFPPAPVTGKKAIEGKLIDSLCKYMGKGSSMDADQIRAWFKRRR